MLDLAELNLRIWKLSLSCELSWDNDCESETPAVIGPPELIDMPQLELDDEPDEVDGIGFRA